MAKTYPEFFPREPDEQDPEFEVFQILKNLPDNFSVFYSKKFKGGNHSREECEIDFIVFDGDKSLLCIEVKGGLIEYDGANDLWLQNGRELKVSPDRQASSATNSLIEFLGHHAKDLNVGWCVCFPNCSLPDHVSAPSGLPKAIIIEEGGLLEPEKALSLVSNYYNNKFKRNGVTKLTAQEIEKKLNRGIGFIQKIGVRVARDLQQIIQVTEEQFEVLEDLRLNPRIAVKGYAGSGKTLLAQEFARRLEEDGNRVLLLFFNRVIAKSVRYGFGRDSKIECSTFHSFARHQISKYDDQWWAESSNKSGDFWNEDVPLKLADIPVNSEDQYDAIIVDEGQDFKRNWYDTLELYLSSPEMSHFSVFYDESQDIFGHWSDLPWGSSAAKKVLTKNCRNTKEIVSYLNSIFDGEIKTFDQSPLGAEVVVRKPKSSSDAVELLKRDITQLLADGVEPGQIVILVDQPKSESVLAGVDQIGRVAIEGVGTKFSSRSRSLRYSSIRRFKGLESDVVFALQSHDCSNQAYAECSRAKILLYRYIGLSGCE